MDLYAERQVVRQMARRNSFSGRTYDSVESITEFFAPRGAPAAPPAPRPAAASAPAPKPARPAPSFRAGQRIQHPKFGAGLIVRREGDGDDAKLTVSFERHGVKKVIQKFATIRQE